MRVRLAGLCVASVTLAAGAASAADLPLKAVPVAALQSWTGFYIGGGFGTGFLNAATTPVATATGGALTTPVTNGGRGWLGTVTAGYDIQATNRIVAGVFGDYDFSNIKGNFLTGSATNFFNPLGGEEKMKSAWAIGARAGVLVTPNVLAYLNGGYTQGRFSSLPVENQGTTPGTLGSAFGDQTYRGWFLGTGVETQLSILGPGWYSKTEYRYADYGTQSPTSTGAIFAPGGTVASLQIHPVVQTVRTELTYKFNAGRSSLGVQPSAAAFASVPAANWTGFYVGGGGGYGFMNADTTPFSSVTGESPSSPPFSSVTGGALTSPVGNSGRGGFGTVTAGYDIQATSRIVAGVFGDYDFASIKGNFLTGSATSYFNPLGGEGKMKSAWAVGARGGVLVAPTVLAYVNGGFTQARFSALAVENQGNTPGTLGIAFGDQTYQGWFLGSGAEMQLSSLGPNWFMRTEYRYADYGTRSPASTGVAFAPGENLAFLKIHPVVQTARAELTYKFNWR